MHADRQNLLAVHGTHQGKGYLKKNSSFRHIAAERNLPEDSCDAKTSPRFPN